MKSITIRIPARAAATDAIALEWYEWRNDSARGVRAKKNSAPPDLTGAAPTLEQLRNCLNDKTASPALASYGQAMHQAICSGAWQTLWQGLEPQRRTYLHVEDKNLRDLPWELWNDGLPLAR